MKAWKKGEFCKVQSNHREGLLPTKLRRLVLFCIHLEVPGVPAELEELLVLLPLAGGLVEEGALDLEDVEEQPGPGAHQVDQPGVLLDGGQVGLLEGEQTGAGEGEKAGGKGVLLVIVEEPGV